MSNPIKATDAEINEAIQRLTSRFGEVHYIEVTRGRRSQTVNKKKSTLTEETENSMSKSSSKTLNQSTTE